MGVSYLVISSVCTVFSVIGLQCWTEISLHRFRSDGLINGFSKLLLLSHVTLILLAVCAVNIFALLVLSLKTVFFGELYSSETRKLVERLVHYVLYKGVFLPLIIPPTISQAGLWLTWLTILCSLKMFQALARDRLERLNSSPSVNKWMYIRVFSALLWVLAVDIFWLWICLVVYGTSSLATFWLFLFEPLSIAFETSQAVVIHGFQLLDIWLYHSSQDAADCHRFEFFNTSIAGFLREWKSSLVWNLGFFLDMMTLLMALGHYVLIWWLHGMGFHIVDAVLLLNIRALGSAIVKRIQGFIKLRQALGTLHHALPDATFDEIQSYDDECAICREPMAKAKKLPCSHLFHLACLRSWLDQGLSDMNLCPTCRKPFFVGRAEDPANVHASAASTDEQLARQLSARIDHPNTQGHVGLFPLQNQNSLETGPWRGSGLDPSWLPPWRSQDGAGPSTAGRSVGLGRVQMMMRHLASVGETYAQTALDDNSWSLWPTNPSQASTSDTPIPPPNTPQAYHRNPHRGFTHRRGPSLPVNENITNLLAMADTVREVLPLIPDEVIFQELQRTNSVTVTVNNLLQM